MFNDKTLYSDVMLQLFSAYITSESEEDRYSNVTDVLLMTLEDPEVGGPGILAGLIYASIIHMSLLLGTVSQDKEISKQQALQLYALAYSNYRDDLGQLPQLNPSFVNEVIKKYF